LFEVLFPSGKPFDQVIQRQGAFGEKNLFHFLTSQAEFACPKSFLMGAF